MNTDTLVHDSKHIIPPAGQHPNFMKCCPSYSLNWIFNKSLRCSIRQAAGLGITQSHNLLCLQKWLELNPVCSASSS